MLGYFDLFPLIPVFAKTTDVFQQGHTNHLEVEAGVTTICEPPENRALAIADAVQFFAYKLSGATKDQIEASLAKYRQLRSVEKK